MGADRVGERRPGVGVGVIVRRGDEVLLVRRRHQGAGTWSAPGGYLDLGEDLAAAARREVREETGLDVADLRFLAVGNDRYADGKHNVTIWFGAESGSGEAVIAAPDELSEVGWFAWDALPDPIYESTARFMAGDTLPTAAVDTVRPAGAPRSGRRSTRHGP